MGSARKRRVGNDNESPAMASHQQRKMQKTTTRKLNHLLFTLGAASFIFVFVIGSYLHALPWSLYAHGTNALDNIALSLGMQQHVYAVVIDAGSTGSRVLAFTFHKSLLGLGFHDYSAKYMHIVVVPEKSNGNLKLDGELFHQMKPGLSSFVDDSKEGGKQMLSLLERAKEVVPVSERGVTPLAMKATAGLRLLPREKADMLLEEVREVFRESPFHTTLNSVSIMDGTDEGLFSWFTVNFLLDRFGDGPEETVAALDLGGGSTQITFALSEVGEAAIRAHDPESVHEIAAFHHKLSVYTHSYLGLGLMAARQGILTAGQSGKGTAVHSPCVNPIINTTWEYAGILYNVMGSENPTILHINTDKSKKGSMPEERPIVNYTECEIIVKSYVAEKVYKPKDLMHRKIYAFSYYFDRATEVGLIDEFKGGVLSVKHFMDAAESVCGVPNADQPLMCLDLTFIVVLLRDGFGLPPETKINLIKQIDNHEISWALGAAFHILENGV